MRRYTILLLFCFLAHTDVRAYAVLTHQALIDAAWDKNIVPLLQARFPGADSAALHTAHAYAYGGAITPDMGYYPFGSSLFTNLTHYVRSGDFIQALLRGAESIEGYAFALGALCHYFADVYGHPLGTNKSVPLIYPGAGEKHGAVITYEQDKLAHIRTEFGFDVLQTARGNYASKAYHDFIGFKVDTALLEKAFFGTYALHLRDIFPNFPRALNTFRWSVAHLIPTITRTAWAGKRSEIRKLNPTATSRNFKFRMQRRNFRKTYGKEYDKPRFGTRVTAFLVRILPKIGPLRILKFRAPGPVAEKYFIQSFDTTLVFYNRSLAQLKTGVVNLANRDFDTGQYTHAGEYNLADDTYNTLVMELHDKKFAEVSSSLKEHLLAFYSKGNVQERGTPEATGKLKAALMALSAASR